MAIASSNDVFYYFLFLVWFLTALLVHSLVKAWFKLKPRSKIPLPPSPPSLPFLGHLHLIGSVLPKSLQGLACKHGSLMRLRLGASSCVVASSASIAREMLKTQELNFSSRPEFGSSEHFIYRGSRFIMAPYGDYWRFMKKLTMTRLLAVPQLERFLYVREEEVERLVGSVIESARRGTASDLSKELTTFTNNVICRMVMSTRCSGTANGAKDIHKLVKTCLKLAGKLSAGDVLGPLRWLDFSGNGKKLEATLWEFNRIVEQVMNEHEEKLVSGSVTERKDLMDILLETHNDPTAEMKITRKDMKSFILDLFMAGTDTSSTAMQWAMAELINRPEAFRKLRDEINSVVGPTRLVRESDVPNLPYLRAVIKETLRLHPSAPIILRECGEDCSVDGCLVEAKSRVLVNVYAIMRDPEIWTDPDEFVPERFLESSDEKIGEHQMEFKGQNFRYLPFGSGRRGCAGASLAMLMMHPAVGSLVQCFDWKMMEGEEAVDMSLGPGFGAEMAKPLVCYPIVHVNPFGHVMRK
ncbi:3,9-dihydroxypterocarpan 6A-monooxygenase-like [Rhodamnia argentea]|uniref:3,9-dihydroxypterocarpan 6A-monooxygenase-like n=1 Tax=Rhodamnia argentea TaxID=178133 RepID=A0ABM3HPZ9_9MYRT|nr:3,9-dihydroxypterocarpan 6A-monooxygenase-like [Rhodamnia argentea]